MRYSQYKFNFYLNATHAIYINGRLGEPHPHTWEIVIHAIKKQGDFVMFNEVEKAVEKYLEKYQNKFINDFEPFTKLNPILENITRFFMEQFTVLLDSLGWIIFSIEISETPTRSYIISTVENNIVDNLKQENLAKDIIENAFE
jgi:6-pyruvoyltetrahydropterin/6-carboxytetrahydropterin synthase